MSNNGDFACVFMNLYRWCPGSGEENILWWKPLGICAHLLVACTGRIIHCMMSGDDFFSCAWSFA